MKHYRSEEWKEFFHGRSDWEKETQMESHLRNCPECQQILVQVLGHEELAQAALLIPPGFAARVVEQAARQKTSPTKSGPGRFNQNRALLKYYAAAAAVTILMTYGGVLQGIHARLANWPEMYSPPSRQYTHILFDWPSQLRDKTAGLLSISVPKSEREVK